MSEIIYLVEFKLPDFPWTHWQACATIEEAEQALTARRKELAEPTGQRVSFRIVRHEIIDNDVAGPIDVEKCSLGHNFAKLPSHPKEQGTGCCPHCLQAKVKQLEQEVYSQLGTMQDLNTTIANQEYKLAKLSAIVLNFVRTSDRRVSDLAFIEYEKYVQEHRK
jgi:uncharacterized coiled-coil protein SlyX